MSIMSIDLLQMLFNAAVFMIIMQGSEVKSIVDMQTDFLKEALQEVSMDNFY